MKSQKADSRKAKATKDTLNENQDGAVMENADKKLQLKVYIWLRFHLQRSQF